LVMKAIGKKRSKVVGWEIIQEGAKKTLRCGEILRCCSFFDLYVMMLKRGFCDLWRGVLGRKRVGSMRRGGETFKLVLNEAGGKKKKNVSPRSWGASGLGQIILDTGDNELVRTRERFLAEEKICKLKHQRKGKAMKKWKAKQTNKG